MLVYTLYTFYLLPDRTDGPSNQSYAAGAEKSANAEAEGKPSARKKTSEGIDPSDGRSECLIL